MSNKRKNKNVLKKLDIKPKQGTDMDKFHKAMKTIVSVPKDKLK